MRGRNQERNKLNFLQVWAGMLTGLLLIAVGSFAWTARAQNDSSKKSNGTGAGVMVSKEATAKEVGLPLYPGAKPHKDENNDSTAAQLGLWGGAFGFKL